jgi:hypothetical protein
MKVSIPLFLVLLMASLVSSAKYVSLSSTLKEQTGAHPIVRVIKDDATQCVLSVTIPGYFAGEVIAAGKQYTTFELANDANVNIPGQPCLPFVSTILSIPFGKSLIIDKVITESPTILENVSVMPVQNEWEHNPTNTFLIDGEIYNSNTPYPQQIATLDSALYNSSSNQYARIVVNPFIYTPSEEKVTIYQSITVTLSKIENKLEKTSTLQKMSSGDALKNMAINSGTFNSLRKVTAERTNKPKVLMIIVPNDNYKVIVSEYAQWKHISGVYTKLVTKAECGSSVSQVKDYIKKAYEDPNRPLTDVILVGKLNDIPSQQITLGEWSFYSDNFYGCITGNDYIPEIFVGRIPVNSAAELKVVMKKLLTYEKTPYMEKTDWYKKAIMCANNEYASQAETKRTVAAILNANGYNVDTLMMKMQGTSPTKNNVISSLTAGKAFLNYRGEGWSDGWDGYGGFGVDDVSSINNVNMLTFFTSIGCGVACWFDEELVGFGETLLRLGTEQQLRGAVTFIGPVSNTNTAYNNNIDRGIYKGLFNEGLETPSDALLRGLAEMLSVFGGTDGKVQMHYQEYTILGDPTLRLYKDIPKRITIEKPSTLPVGQSQCLIKIKLQGNPVSGVTVCGTTKDGIYSTAVTDAQGGAVLNFRSDKEEILTVVAKGNSVYPVIDSIRISPKTIYCAPGDTIIVNDKSGNSDGMINPNEQVALEFTIKNYGQNTATGIAVSLTSPSPSITLNNNQNVPVADILKGFNGQKVSFSCKASESCSAGTVIPLIMVIKSEGNTDTFYLSITIQACNLLFTSLRVVELEKPISSPNRLDPGEKAKLIIKIQNTGMDNAVNITGKLTSDNPFITISDNSGSFGTLQPGGTAENSSDFFTVEVSSACSTNYSIEAILELQTNNSTYSYTVKKKILIPVSVPLGTDPTGPDHYGYSIIASTDTLFKNAPKFSWNEINQKGTKVPINFDLTSARQVVSLPFTFKFYGKSYTKCVIHLNGMISFDEQSSISRYNLKLAPETDGFKSFISAIGPSQDEISLNDGSMDTNTSKIYYYNDTQNKRFIVQYHNINGLGDCQIVLRDPSDKKTLTGDGEIYLAYKNFEISENGLYSFLVGIENETETSGLAYYLNKKHDQTASDIYNQTTLLITTDKPEIDSSKISTFRPNARILLLHNFGLHGIYPNPVTSSASIVYSLPQKGIVKIAIFNVSGREVKAIPVNAVGAGIHTVIWDGKDKTGLEAGAGMYIVNISFNGKRLSQQLIKAGK